MADGSLLNEFEDAGAPQLDPTGAAPPSFPARHQRKTDFAVSLADLSFGKHRANIPVWRYWFLLSLVLEDIAAMLLSLVICLWIKPDSYLSLPDSVPLYAFVVLQCGIWLFSLMGAGAYRRHIMTDGYQIYTIILNSALITIVVTGYLVYMFDLNLPRTAVIEAPVLAAFVEIFLRWGSRKILLQVRKTGNCKYDTVILGSAEGICESIAMLEKNTSLGYRPVAVCPVTVSADSTHSITAIENAHTLCSQLSCNVLTFSKNIANDMHAMHAQILLVTDTVARDSEQMRALSLLLESRGIELAFTVSVADVSGHRLHMRDTMQQNVLTASLPQYTLPAALVKRLFDIVVSTLALLIGGPLVMLPIALAIKSEDGGPVFYAQERIGKNGKPFKFYKFRSMQMNADQLDAEMAAKYGQEYGALFKLKDDPRVTEVGKIIRKFSLDEIPQFFNVFKGNMSIVGPRPQRQYEVDK